MEKESVRISMNKFLKMYFDSCSEVYEEINFGRITGKQFKYLKVIHKEGEVTLTSLAEALNITKPTMNEFINKFLDAGIVKKRKSSSDRRVSYISLTKVGVVLATSNLLESQRAVKKITEKLSDNEVGLLVELFDKFGDEEL